MTIQRDYIIEAEDRLVVRDDAAVQSIVNRLMPTPLLRIADVAAALDVSVQQVHNWIESGRFKCMVIGCGGGRKHRRIVRVSFVEFLKSSVG